MVVRGAALMRSMVPPLAGERGDLLENDTNKPPDGEPEKGTSWRWMVSIAVVVGLFAWFTR